MPGQTELHVWGATTDELARGTGNSSRFPAAYKQAAVHLKPGLTLYVWSLARPGVKPAPTFDELYQVNGHWVAISRPWRATRSALASKAATSQ